MKRKTGNWMVKIVRLNQDGTRDYVNTLETATIESAKRQAATWSRESGIIATIFDVFNHCAAIYQYRNGHKVAGRLLE